MQKFSADISFLQCSVYVQAQDSTQNHLTITSKGLLHHQKSTTCTLFPPKFTSQLPPEISTHRPKGYKVRDPAPYHQQFVVQDQNESKNV